MSVCIVGNSDNVLYSGLGSAVDQCDNVIRINDFLLTGYEEDVGKKTTIIACAFSAANKVTNNPSWPTRNLLKEVVMWATRPPRGDRISRANNCGLSTEKITYPMQPLYEFLIVKVYSKFWRKEPSSGLVAIAMAMEMFGDQKIYIHGFDNRTGKEGKKHYFDPDFLDIELPNDPVGHDWESENIFIDDLIASSRIERLS